MHGEEEAVRDIFLHRKVLWQKKPHIATLDFKYLFTLKR